MRKEGKDIGKTGKGKDNVSRPPISFGLKVVMPVVRDVCNAIIVNIIF